MSATNSVETALLNLIFAGTTWTSMADNTATSPATAFYISLHTASPGETGDQTSNEVSYTGYARVSVSRDASGWTVTGNSCTNDAEIAFGQCTASPGSNITHVGLGLSSTGTGTLLLYNALDSSVAMQVGTVPIFSATELEFTCD